MRSTKQRILHAALTLFSEEGYEAVRVEQIAQCVGIKAPSLYKHYKSKQAIFDAILTEMQNRYHQQMTQMQMSGAHAPADVTLFADASQEQLLQMGMGLFQYFLHDESVKKFRKMLTIEQYHNEELARLYTKQYVDDPLSYQSLLFHLLAQAGLLQGEDQEIMALHFYSPIYFLLTLCDRNPEREQAALQMLEKHIKAFHQLYRNEKEES